MVSMYDDRLEIESPGRLPDIVTVDNIAYTRFSRNKTISRVMTEFEWVRELNEGVKKIYSDMADAGLPAPEYIETPNTVKLILRNNIDERTIQENKASSNSSNDVLKAVSDDIEKQIINLLSENGELGRAKIVEEIKQSDRTVSRKLSHLVEMGIIVVNGNKYDKNHTYSLK